MVNLEQKKSITSQKRYEIQNPNNFENPRIRE